MVVWKQLPLVVQALVMVQHFQHVLSRYSNVTLTSNGGDLSVVVYLPSGIKPDQTYYSSTRFEHGSMIGAITRRSRDAAGNEHRHVLYGTNRWRVPHDPYWPESGVGLASEFGVGDDGAFCNYRCGWYGVNDVTNGVLGYREARSGESFLKIGVGELIKGSCSTCDSTDDFKFNSPYKFAKPPLWTMQSSDSHNSVTLEHEAGLNQHGYRLRKDITLINNELLVKTTLTNVGRTPFSTAWYSHHFYTCDGEQVGPGYSVDVNLAGTGGAFEEPGTWFWSKPLRDYAEVTSASENVQIQMRRYVERDARIKAEFVRDDTSNGGFTLRACGTAIEEQIPEVGTPEGVSMYAFNLYIEADTFSPEPQILIHLFPGATTSWTQRLIFTDDERDQAEPTNKLLRTTIVSQDSSKLPGLHFVAFLLVVSVIFGSVQRLWKRNSEYAPIPDQ